MTLRDKLKFWLALNNYIEMIVRDTLLLSLPNAMEDSLDYLKALGGTEITPKVYFDSITANDGCEQRNLPAKYTQLEYIESTGTQYIDTGVLGTDKTSVHIKYVATSLSQSSGFGIIGYQRGFKTSPSFQRVLWTSMDNNQFRYGNKLTDTFKKVNVNEVIEETFGNGSWILNGENIPLETTDSFTTSPNTMVLFGLKNQNDDVASFAKIKLYFCSIKENGTLVRNFIPARRNSDSVLGMYDTVSQTFFTNAGTGTFTAGPNAVPTPDTPMDIYCNNGVLKVNLNLYWAEYHGYELSQVDGITTKENGGVNVSGMVDCRTIKSFKITTISPQGAFRIFKYRADNTYIDANSTASIGDIITLEDNVSFFRIQYNFTNSGTGTQNILIYNSAYNLNGIYTDGTVETINVHTRNLCDNNAFQSGYVNPGDGTIRPNSQWLHTDYLYIGDAETYTYSLYTTVSSNAGRECAFYDKDKNFISGNSSFILTKRVGEASKTFTVPEGAKYIRVSVTNISESQKDTSVQLEQGSTATDYVPYYDGGTATAEMLLKVGDYQDVQSILDGVVTRNVGVKVLDGTENWTYNTMISYHFTYKLPKQKDDTVAFYQTYCSHFVSTNTTDNNTCKLQYKTFSIRYDNANGDTTSFKQYLADQYAAGTPVIIVYPLKTPTTESVSGQALQVTEGNNIAEITQASLDNLELEAKYNSVP